MLAKITVCVRNIIFLTLVFIPKKLSIKSFAFDLVNGLLRGKVQNAVTTRTMLYLSLTFIK